MGKASCNTQPHLGRHFVAGGMANDGWRRIAIEKEPLIKTLSRLPTNLYTR